MTRTSATTEPLAPRRRDVERVFPRKTHFFLQGNEVTTEEESDSDVKLGPTSSTSCSSWNSLSVSPTSPPTFFTPEAFSPLSVVWKREFLEEVYNGDNEKEEDDDEDEDDAAHDDKENASKSSNVHSDDEDDHDKQNQQQKWHSVAMRKDARLQDEVSYLRRHAGSSPARVRQTLLQDCCKDDNVAFFCRLLHDVGGVEYILRYAARDIPYATSSSLSSAPHTTNLSWILCYYGSHGVLEAFIKECLAFFLLQRRRRNRQEHYPRRFSSSSSSRAALGSSGETVEQTSPVASIRKRMTRVATRNRRRKKQSRRLGGHFRNDNKNSNNNNNNSNRAYISSDDDANCSSPRMQLSPPKPLASPLASVVVPSNTAPYEDRKLLSPLLHTPTSLGSSPMRIAVFRNHFKCLRLLLPHLDTSRYEDHQQDAMSDWGSPEKHEAAAAVQEKRQASLAVLAASLNHVESLQALAEERWPPSIEDVLNGWSPTPPSALSESTSSVITNPLLIACRNGALNVVKYLWQAKSTQGPSATVDFAVRDDAGFPPAALAAMRNQTLVLSYFASLSKSGGPILNARIENPKEENFALQGGTPLHVAVHYGQVEAAELLLQHRRGAAGCDVTARDYRGRTALHHAAAANSIPMVKLFVDILSPPELELLDSEDMAGITPLYAACCSAAAPSLPPPPPPNLKFSNDNKDKGEGAEEKMIRHVVELLAPVSDTSYMCPKKDSLSLSFPTGVPIMAEASCSWDDDDEEEEDVVIARPLSPLRTHERSSSASSVWSNGNSTHTDPTVQVATLVAGGGAWSHLLVPLLRQPPLLAAALRNNVQAVTALLAAGADINATDDEGHTALLVAAKYGYYRLCQVLLTARADVSRQSHKRGGTPIQKARKYGHEHVVELLSRYDRKKYQED